MIFQDNVIKEYLRNVYFIAGTPCAGKTTVTKALGEKYGVPIYEIDEQFTVHQLLSDKERQPNMNRRFMNADEFFSRVVVDQIGAVGMVEGENFSFGRNREGSKSRLKELAERRHIEVTIAPSVAVAGTIVSSSAIRKALEKGAVELAAEMLGRRYCVRGIVGRGDMRGRTLGFPTANLTKTEAFLPGNALYAAIARTEDGVARPAAVNLGDNPTFGIGERKIEAHLQNFSGDLYDKPLTLEFCSKLRDVVKFPSKEALQEQMTRDVARTREIVGPALF